ncbi:IS3 family transposase [Myroides odoratimimus]|uniref:IS3 family transposase n=1 Tax=Myroides odoratimimus TaxID=76832 RepID=UPI001F3D9A50|nr:IS3 family transposase [Myroides odoratimimus]WHT72884.1 IS3 family transposase [Myroides odoratimimus]WHU37468.1 IS3 family transposase [Myroides odoratimimus]
MFSNPLHESTLFLVCSSLYYFKQTYYLTLAYEIWAWSGGYHIEAYHGTLKREVFTKFEYFTFGQIEQILKKYVVFYNNKRLHGLLGKITPMEKWEKDKHLICSREKVA